MAIYCAVANKVSPFITIDISQPIKVPVLCGANALLLTWELGYAYTLINSWICIDHGRRYRAITIVWLVSKALIN